MVTAVDKLATYRERAMLGGALGLFVDTYDIWLPALVLPAAMGFFEPASLPVATKVTLTNIVFAIALAGRPLGAAIFGNLSDRVGRKRVGMITGFGFTLTTLLLAIMPGYHSLGYGAIVGLILLRLLDGVFLGGGYASFVPLTLERTTRTARGWIGGLLGAVSPFALVFISIIQLVALSSMSSTAFAQWGWRIPFLIGVLLGFLYLAYFRGVEERLLVEDRGRTKPPLWELVSGTNLAALGRGLLLASGYWFAVQMTAAFVPSLLITGLHQPPRMVSWIVLVGQVGTMGASVLAGYLSQRFGRRRLLMLVGAWIAVGVNAAYYGMIQAALAHGSGVLVGLLAVIVLAGTGGLMLGLIFTYLNESFPTRIRSTGYSVSYSFGTILPAFSSVYLLWFSKLVPYLYTELILVFLGGICILCASSWGPETRDADLS